MLPTPHYVKGKKIMSYYPQALSRSYETDHGKGQSPVQAGDPQHVASIYDHEYTFSVVTERPFANLTKGSSKLQVPISPSHSNAY